MKHALFFFILLGAFSIPEAGFRIEPVVEHGFASLIYRIRFQADSGLDSITEVKYGGESELEYPADVAVAGLKVSYTLASPYVSSIELTGKTNLTQPFLRPMQDSDWLSVYLSDQAMKAKVRFKFSYTESSSKLQYASGRIGVHTGSSFESKSWRFGLFYTLEYFFNEVYGIHGWQYRIADSTDTLNIDRSNKIFFDTLGSTMVNTYEAFLHQISVRAEWLFWRGKTVTGSFVTLLSPLVMAHDEDYHLLRSKKSNAQAFGAAIHPSIQLVKRISDRWYLEGTMGATYLRTHGSMTQTYYRTTDEAEAGTQIKDIETDILLYKAYLGATASFVF
jgi:hypothetical protein